MEENNFVDFVMQPQMQPAWMQQARIPPGNQQQQQWTQQQHENNNNNKEGSRRSSSSSSSQINWEQQQQPKSTSSSGGGVLVTQNICEQNQQEIELSRVAFERNLHQSRRQNTTTTIAAGFLEAERSPVRIDGAVINYPSTATSRPGHGFHDEDRTAVIKNHPSTASSRSGAMPGKKPPRRITKIEMLDRNQVGCLRRKINELYSDKVYPTMKLLLNYAKEELNYDGSRTTLLAVIRKKLGFKFKKVNGHKFLMERHEVRLLRFNFLKNFRKLREEGRNFIFLDETWIRERPPERRQKSALSPESAGKKRGAPSGVKGWQLMALHAGGKTGFVRDCLLTSVYQFEKIGYHIQMNATIFTEWFKEKLLPNIPANSVIVMDNAAYHSVRRDKHPTPATRKSEMLDWLHSRGIWEANNSMLKLELYQMIVKNKPKLVRYVIDELAAKCGHTVLRAPEYHGELNPMGLAWAKIREDLLNAENQSCKTKDVDALTRELCARLGAESWQDFINQTEKNCEEALANEGVMETCVEELINNIGEGDSDSESFSD